MERDPHWGQHRKSMSSGSFLLMGDSTATGVATNITSNQLFITFHPVSPLIICSRGHTSGMFRLETSSTGRVDAFMYSFMMAHRIWSIMVIMHQSDRETR